LLCIKTLRFSFIAWCLHLSPDHKYDCCGVSAKSSKTYALVVFIAIMSPNQLKNLKKLNNTPLWRTCKLMLVQTMLRKIRCAWSWTRSWLSDRCGNCNGIGDRTFKHSDTKSNQNKARMKSQDYPQKKTC
jgi:hypothetical protein